MTKYDRQTQKKQEILDLMSKYKDEHGNVDMTKFREEQTSAYARIPYYFKSVEGALQALNSGLSSEVSKGSPTNKLTLRNSLAYDKLVELRKNHTLEEIGNMYGGVSKAYVRQLFESLEMSVGAKRKEQLEKENKQWFILYKRWKPLIFFY